MPNDALSRAIAADSTPPVPEAPPVVEASTKSEPAKVEVPKENASSPEVSPTSPADVFESLLKSDREEMAKALHSDEKAEAEPEEAQQEGAPAQDSRANSRIRQLIEREKGLRAQYTQERAQSQQQMQQLQSWAQQVQQQMQQLQIENAKLQAYAEVGKPKPEPEAPELVELRRKLIGADSIDAKLDPVLKERFKAQEEKIIALEKQWKDQQLQAEKAQLKAQCMQEVDSAFTNILFRGLDVGKMPDKQAEDLKKMILSVALSHRCNIAYGARILRDTILRGAQTIAAHAASQRAAVTAPVSELPALEKAPKASSVSSGQKTPSASELKKMGFKDKLAWAMAQDGKKKR